MVNYEGRQRPSTPDELAPYYREVIRRLSVAIGAHQVFSADREPSDVDRRLWSVLTDITVPLGTTEDASVAWMVENVWWDI